jgi:phytoene synthase
VTGETRKGSSHSDAAPRRSSLAGFVREHDRDRYQTALFAPADCREKLFVLYAFNYEVARVRESVNQPMLGQIRLQWWREVVAAAYGDAPVRQHAVEHEVAGPLAALIRRSAPSRRHFDRIIDAREGDLADIPPPDLAGLEDYAEATSSSLLYLAAEVAGAADPAAVAAAREVGILYAMAGLLRAMPLHAAAGRSYIPADLALRLGLDPEDYARRRDSPALRRAIAELAEAARGHLAAAQHDARWTPRRARSLLLPAVIADRILLRLERAGYNPFAAELAAPDTLQSWRLFAAALRQRF